MKADFSTAQALDISQISVQVRGGKDKEVAAVRLCLQGHVGSLNGCLHQARSCQNSQEIRSKSSSILANLVAIWASFNYSLLYGHIASPPIEAISNLSQRVSYLLQYVHLRDRDRNYICKSAAASASKSPVERILLFEHPKSSIQQQLIAPYSYGIVRWRSSLLASSPHSLYAIVTS